MRSQFTADMPQITASMARRCTVRSASCEWVRVMGSASLGRHRESCAGLVLLREILERRLADVDHHFDDLAGEGERSLVQVGNRRAGIAADVEAFVCRE